MKVLDQVCIVSLQDHRFDDAVPDGKPRPRVGDFGIIVGVVDGPCRAFDVECSNPGDGTTRWREIMFPSELVDADSAITHSSGNVFIDLGFPPEQAAELLAQAEAKIAAGKTARSARARRSKRDDG